MKYTASGLALTEQFEGFSSKAYQDSGGVWTCGYGHTKGVTKDTTCTRASALVWLTQDVMEAEQAVNALVDVELNQNEFNALVDFVFNLGGHAFAKSTLLKLLNAGDHAAAADEFEKWGKCKGVVLAGLLRRRLAEKKLFNDQK